MEFEVLEQLGEQFERLSAAPTRRRPFRLSSSAAVVAALCTGIVGTASAATVIVVRSAGDDPAAEKQRASKSPDSAPPRPAGSYSALADGKVHDGPQVPGAHVTVHGTRRGGCIRLLFDGDRGPAGTCFSEQDLDATPIWNTVRGILVVLVPDTATNITIEAIDGSRRPATATSNLVVADHDDIVEYSVASKIVKVVAVKSSS